MNNDNNRPLACKITKWPMRKMISLPGLIVNLKVEASFFMDAFEEKTSQVSSYGIAADSDREPG